MSDDEDLFSEDESLRDLSILRSRDASKRKRCTDSLGKLIDAWICTDDDCEDHDESKALSELLPSVLMLSLRCPFSDVREKCSHIIDQVKKKGLGVPRALFKGPSSFIPSREIPPIDTDDEQTHNMFIESFMSTGRVSSVTSVMSIHIQYLEWFSRTEFYVMQGEGPLPFDWRHYIAIMAASRHQCCYLVNIYEMEFIKFNGNREWLKGMKHVPRKLQRLSEINKYLAHQPWLIETKQIETLLKGDDNWSLSELIQAIVILAHFHSLSSFVFGCGVVPEIDQESGHSFGPLSLSDSNHASFDNSAVDSKNVDGKNFMTGEELVERMKEVLAEQEQQMEASQEELFHHFEKLESGELAQSTNETTKAQDCQISNVAHYLEDPKFHYKDFASREHTEISTFRIGDCSWEEQGYSLVNRLYPDMGTILDEKFSSALSLTYLTLGDKTNVDTTLFRRATWNYIHLIFGIYHDDYLYTEVNKLMERSYKRYIKTVATCPQKTTLQDYMEFMPQLTHSERVHINLLLLEARMQAELLYAVRAILKYMR